MRPHASPATGRKSRRRHTGRRMGNRRRPPLELLVFVVGIATLGSEIAVARLIAPFFGDSTIVWANTIAVVLVALSIGYWFGGRLADRHPHLQGLCVLVLASSVLLAVVPIVAQPLLSLSVDAFDDVSIGGFAGSLFGVLALVSIPVLMLGAVSPWAIRLKLERVEDSGETAGPDVRDLDGRLAGRDVQRLAAADPARRHAAHVPRLRDPARASWPRSASAGAGCSRRSPSPRCCCCRSASSRRRRRGAWSTRPRRRTSTRGSIEYPDGRRQLELNEGQAIHSIWRARHRADRQLLGRAPDAAVHAPRRRRRARSRCSAWPAAPWRARTRSTSPTRSSTPSRSTASCSTSGGAGSAWRTAPAAAAPRRRRAPVPAQDGRALRLHLPRHLPPALHPVLPRHQGVLRAGARPARARRRGDHQRRPSGGLARSSSAC